MSAELPAEDRKRLVASNIRRLREERGMSQTQLALALDVTQQEISRWERGVWEPDRRNVQRIAGVFGVPWWTLYQPNGEAAA